jgi:glycosyltransferase involved in cell wall biosynthesis
MTLLSLAMIVKNEEFYLKDCLESVKGIADEIVIADTGSNDNTLKIAREYNAKIFSFDWINDFSAARNFALSKCTGDWILYLDADERLSKNSVDEIKELINRKEYLAVKCLVKSIDSDYGRDNSMIFPRLFRSNPNLEFTGRVHEQIDSSLKKLNYVIMDSGIEIIHLGYNVFGEIKRAKANRNLNLLLEEYNSNKSSYAAFQLAQTYNILEEYDEAYSYALASINDQTLDKTHRANLLGLISFVELKKHKTQAAFRHISTALDLDKKQPYLNLLASKISFRLNDLVGAKDYLKYANEYNDDLKTGKIKSGINFILNDEEIFYFGLIVALKNKSNADFQFWLDKLKNPGNGNVKQSGNSGLSLIDKLYRKIRLDSKEEKTFAEYINKDNIDLFLELIKDYPFAGSKLILLEKLFEKEKDNSSVCNLYGIALADAGNNDKAIELLNANFENDKQNPTIIFYLISLLLKKNEFTKISELLRFASENFSHIPEVKSRLQIITEKLTSLLGKQIY